MHSFINVAPESDFPLQNLPFGVYERVARQEGKHCAVAIGEYVVDLKLLAERGYFPGPLLSRLATECFSKPCLNEFMSLGRGVWREARHTLTRLFSSQEGCLRDNQELLAEVMVPRKEAIMQLPALIGDYTDFYASREHATNVGTMFRGKDNALNPNWLHLPVGYHGRASSIVCSPTDFPRPLGQVLPAGATAPVMGLSKALDYELEVACFIGTGNPLGSPIPVSEAEEHVFGLVLMNDWSARDLQKWEYVPLGPFTGKNFCTQISPWVVTLDALEPFICEAPPQDPEVLSYLKETDRHTYDVTLEVEVVPEGNRQGTTLTKSNLKYLYWTFSQMISHHTLGGCNLRPGDLLGSGTISGPGEDERGCLLEKTWGGKNPVMLQGDAGVPVPRTYLLDGDQVVLKGYCQGQGYRVGFGECRGKVCQGHPSA